MQTARMNLKIALTVDRFNFLENAESVMINTVDQKGVDMFDLGIGIFCLYLCIIFMSKGLDRTSQAKRFW